MTECTACQKLSERLDALEQRLTREVRTQRLVVEDDLGVERITASASGIDMAELVVKGLPGVSTYDVMLAAGGPGASDGSTAALYVTADGVCAARLGAGSQFMGYPGYTVSLDLNGTERHPDGEAAAGASVRLAAYGDEAEANVYSSSGIQHEKDQHYVRLHAGHPTGDAPGASMFLREPGVERELLPGVVEVDEVRCKRLVVVDQHGRERIEALAREQFAEVKVRTRDADSFASLHASEENVEPYVGLYLSGAGDGAGGIDAQRRPDGDWTTEVMLRDGPTKGEVTLTKPDLARS